jgi:hypothetical protein
MRPRESPSDLFEILQSEGLLTADGAEALRRRTSDRWAPIGKILRQHGWLSMAQLLDLLDRQSQEPSARFGELAVRLGYCTRAQVEKALQEQCELAPHPLAELLRDPAIDRAKLTTAIVRYVRMLEGFGGESGPSAEERRTRRSRSPDEVR